MERVSGMSTGDLTRKLDRFALVGTVALIVVCLLWRSWE